MHVGIEAVFDPHVRVVLWIGEDRVDGDAGDGDLFGGDAKGLQVFAGLVHRDEVLLVMMAQPHRVDVKVGDHDDLPARSGVPWPGARR